MAAAPHDNVKKSSTPMLDEEAHLRRALSAKEVNFGDLNNLLDSLRLACRDSLAQNVVGAGPNVIPGLGGRLWEAHLKVNARYRKALSQMHESRNRKRTPVESRKLESHYIQFIKASQRFYRELIANIRSLFETVHELELIAATHEFQYEHYYSLGPKRQVDDATRQRILTTCRGTLIRLGDLSRYREMELTTNPRLRKWTKPIAYYSLASTICPDSGMPQNQLAIIGLAEGNHLEAMYRLYRSACSRDPHPSASENLHIEFKKILAAWAKGEPLSIVNDVKSSIVSLFIYFHAKCAQGHKFAEREELMSEFLRQIQLDLKEGTFERDLLQRFALINIAAEHHAQFNAGQSSSKGDLEASLNALRYFRELNVRFCLGLFMLLISESHNASTLKDGREQTPVVRCIMPTLRHYSSWLQSSCDYMLSPSTQNSPNAYVKEFFVKYAELLNALTSTYDIVELGEVVTYLLDEDEEIIGFTPLSNQFTAERFENEDKQRKARLHTVKERKPESLEMLFRIKEVVREGLTLVVSEKVPILLVDQNNTATFLYKDDMSLPTSQTSLPSEMASSRAKHPLLAGSRSDQNFRTMASPANGDNASNAGSASYALAMDRMVDSLVDSDVPHGSGPVFGAPNQQLSGNQHPRQLRLGSLSAAGQTVQSPFPTVEPEFSSYSPPALPSILNTPFAPQPSDAFLGAKDLTTPFGAPGQIHPSAAHAHHPSLHVQPSHQKTISDPASGFPPQAPNFDHLFQVQPYASNGQPHANAREVSMDNRQLSSISSLNNSEGRSYDLTQSAKVPPTVLSSQSFNQAYLPAWSHFRPLVDGTNGENAWGSGPPGFGAVGSGRRQGG